MRLFRFLSVLLITALAVSVGSAQPSTIKSKPSFTDVSASVQQVYTSQLGVRELTGKNDGIQVEYYLQSVGLGKGYPWCAGFVKWCYLKADVKEAKQINAMALSVNNRTRWVYANNKFIQEPSPGDAFTLYYPHLKRIGHTGFYDGRQNTHIYKTVEGNTNSAGSREGDGVYRKYRSFKSTYSINRWITSTSKIIKLEKPPLHINISTRAVA